MLLSLFASGSGQFRKFAKFVMLLHRGILGDSGARVGASAATTANTGSGPVGARRTELPLWTTAAHHVCLGMLWIRRSLAGAAARQASNRHKQILCIAHFFHRLAADAIGDMCELSLGQLHVPFKTHGVLKHATTTCQARTMGSH